MAGRTASWGCLSWRNGAARARWRGIDASLARVPADACPRILWENMAGLYSVRTPAA